MAQLNQNQALMNPNQVQMNQNSVQMQSKMPSRTPPQQPLSIPANPPNSNLQNNPINQMAPVAQVQQQQNPQVQTTNALFSKRSVSNHFLILQWV